MDVRALSFETGVSLHGVLVCLQLGHGVFPGFLKVDVWRMDLHLVLGISPKGSLFHVGVVKHAGRDLLGDLLLGALL